MTVYIQAILVLWIVLIVFWAVSARGVKPNVGGTRAWRREIGLRLGIVVLILLAARLPDFRQALRGAWVNAVNTNAAMGLIGVVCCALGIGLAIWARVQLGRNWGLPMSRKENPELITTGPYTVVRHPIYTGILLAMLGSAIGLSLFWLAPLAASVAYFVFSARREEQLMIERFPGEYPAYMKRTSMLLPWVL